MKLAYLNEKQQKTKTDSSKILLIIVVSVIIIANILNAISIIL